MILDRANATAVLVLALALGLALVIFTIAAAVALARGNLDLTNGEIALVSNITGGIVGALAAYLGFGHPSRGTTTNITNPPPEPEESDAVQDRTHG